MTLTRKILQNINLEKNELQNAVVQRSAEPGSPVEGQIYVNSTTHKFGYWNGTTWVYPTEGGSSEATETVLGTIKLAGDIHGGTGSAPHVTHFQLSEAATAGGFKITSLGLCTAATDAANKEYVDAKVNGLSWKNPVVVATAASLPGYVQTGSGPTGTLEASANGALTIDGSAVVVGWRVLVKNGAEAKNNGIYEITQAGGASEKFKMVRTTDANTAAEMQDATMVVEQGTANADKVFNCSTAPPITIDTTGLTFVEIQSGTAVVGDGVYTERSANELKIKPDEVTPVAPAEGAVSAEGTGVTRKKTFRLRGNGALTEFTLTHNFNTRLLDVQGFENAAGTPGLPIELGFETTSANAIKIVLPTAIANTIEYFVAIFG